MQENHLKHNSNTLHTTDQTIVTADGSPSLFSQTFKEHYHCLQGAYNESQYKFIIPSELDKITASNTHALHIIDVCCGMGYNLAGIIDTLTSHHYNRKIYIHSIDISCKPLNYAINHHTFIQLYSKDTIEILRQLASSQSYQQKNITAELYLIDAREFFLKKRHTLYDLVLFDPFSPAVAAELWSVDLIQLIAQSLKNGARWISYSTSAAYRTALIMCGLNVYSLPPWSKIPHSISANTSNIQTNQRWSMGTIAIAPKPSTLWAYSTSTQNALWHPLSYMEQEHLTTRASIPYRDPFLNSTHHEILERRYKEQQTSSLPSASKWRKTWNKQNHFIRKTSHI